MPRLDATVEEVQTPGRRRCHDIALTGIISGPTLESLRNHTRPQAASGIDMVLNLSGLAYINSSGMGELVSLQDILRQYECSLVLYGARPDILRLMRMLGLGEVLRVFVGRDDALAAVDAGPTARGGILASSDFEQVTASGRFVPPAGSTPDEPPSLAVLTKSPNRLTEFLNFYFAKTGGMARVCGMVSECDALLDPRPPRALLIDGTMPDADAVRKRVKTDPAFGLVSLITLMPEGATAKHSGFRVVDDEVVTEPVPVRELLALVESEIQRCCQESVLFRQEAHFEFLSNPESVDQLNETIEGLLHRTELADDSREAFLYAVREAVDNSRRHAYPDRPGVIALLYVLDREKITVTVEDDGPGFDFEAMMSEASLASPVEQARKRHRAGKLGGLGINLMMRCCDKLEYKVPGNIVTLMKYLS